MLFSSVSNQAVNEWDVAKVTDMLVPSARQCWFRCCPSSVFYYANNFNQAVNEWDVARVTSMSTVSVLSVGRQSRPHMFAAAGSRVFCIADNVVFFGFPRALCLLVSLPFFSVLFRK